MWIYSRIRFPTTTLLAIIFFFIHVPPLPLPLAHVCIKANSTLMLKKRGIKIYILYRKTLVTTKVFIYENQQIRKTNIHCIYSVCVFCPPMRVLVTHKWHEFSFVCVCVLVFVIFLNIHF